MVCQLDTLLAVPLKLALRIPCDPPVPFLRLETTDHSDPQWWYMYIYDTVLPKTMYPPHMAISIWVCQCTGFLCLGA